MCEIQRGCFSGPGTGPAPLHQNLKAVRWFKEGLGWLKLSFLGRTGIAKSKKIVFCLYLKANVQHQIKGCQSPSRSLIVSCHLVILSQALQFICNEEDQGKVSTGCVFLPAAVGVALGLVGVPHRDTTPGRASVVTRTNSTITCWLRLLVVEIVRLKRARRNRVKQV
jgi:hypothetical protein